MFAGCLLVLPPQACLPDPKFSILALPHFSTLTRGPQKDDFCAGGSKLLAGACPGDRGAPATQNVNGTATQVGNYGWHAGSEDSNLSGEFGHAYESEGSRPLSWAWHGGVCRRMQAHATLAQAGGGHQQWLLPSLLLLSVVWTGRTN